MNDFIIRKLKKVLTSLELGSWNDGGAEISPATLIPCEIKDGNDSRAVVSSIVEDYRL